MVSGWSVGGLGWSVGGLTSRPVVKGWFEGNGRSLTLRAGHGEGLSVKVKGSR